MRIIYFNTDNTKSKYFELQVNIDLKGCQRLVIVDNRHASFGDNTDRAKEDIPVCRSLCCAGRSR